MPSMVIIVVSCLALVGEIAAADNKRDGWSERHVASMKAVKAMCETTDYKRTCVTTVSESARNNTDTRQLIEVAFEVSMKHITEAEKRSEHLEKVQHDQRTRKALGDCKELMDSAHLVLEHSLHRMRALDLTKLEAALQDMRVWLSAASTYQDTCLEGFENTTGDAAGKMRNNLHIARKMTSNSLAIVTDLSSVLTPFDRLLSRSNVVVWKHSELKPKFVVAQDGSGDFRTIREALLKVPHHSEVAVVIHVRSGVYHEAVEIGNSMTRVVLVGDGPHKTKITGSKNFMDGMPTFRTASFAAKGDFFMAQNIGFENRAGPAKHQAVALRVQSDMSIFYKCSMEGYQDTLYAHTNRQFYRDCTISGTMDFVFGNAAAVFQNCTFNVRKQLDDLDCIVTAHGRTEKRQPTGLVIQNSTFTAEHHMRRDYKTYLGHPRKKYSRTIIMESYIDDLIDPEGWQPWDGQFGLKTCDYKEVDNRGPGAHTNKRVKWEGLAHVSKQHIKDYYTAARFIQGDRWVKNSGVPYNSGNI